MERDKPTTKVRAPNLKSRNAESSGRVQKGVQFIGKRLTVALDSLTVGAAISVYAEGHLLATGTVGELETDLGAFRQLAVEITQLPPLSFPVELRFVYNHTGTEACPSFILMDFEAAVAAVGDLPKNISITSLFKDRLVFDFTIDFFPDGGRSLVLKVNGRVVSEAKSELKKVGKQGSSHRISMTLESPIVEGSIVELIDKSTGATVFQQIPTWIDVIGSVMQGQDDLSERIAQLEVKVATLTKQVVLSSTNLRERALLDRIDLFYAMIQRRLDRELKFASVKSINNPVDELHSQVVLGAAEIEGSGYYNLEGNGEARWRWLGPKVTILLRDISRSATSLRLDLFSVSAEMSVDEIKIHLDGNNVPVKATRAGEDVQIVVDVPAHIVGNSRDKSIIVDIDFPYYFQPEGDQRFLSAAFSGLTILY